VTLTRITITGADDAVDPAELAALSREFPFVEWGVLISDSRAGTPRYPTRAWVAWFEQACWRGKGVHGSAHLCGEAARSVLAGKEERLIVLRAAFERVQLNGFTEASNELLDLLQRWHGIQWILQAPEDSVADAVVSVATLLSRRARVSALWDPSGGRGLRSDSLVASSLIGHVPYGYAGGIGPDNVVETAQVVLGLGASWLDMESGGRTDDRFDLAKVRAVLEAVAPFVEASR